MNTQSLKHMLMLSGCSEESTVLACDQLPKSKEELKNSIGYIVNLQESWRPGNHWIVIFVNDNNNVELFDSLVTSADDNNQYIKIFLENFYKLRMNAGARLQDDVSESCGLYCLYYLYYRCRKKLSIDTIITKLFSDNVTLNECNVIAFINSLYDKKLYQHIKHACK
jgi:hypothetical protein